MNRNHIMAMGLSAVFAAAPPAFAYRPFDGTDADVAGVREFELEIGPAHYLASPAGRYLVAPAVLNLGFAPGFELVVDFKNVVGLQATPGESRVRLLDTDVLVKTVLRRGTLQGESGISIALEAGPLLPELGGNHAFGAQANLITSYRWDALSLHLNTAATLTRDATWDGFIGLIAEGPHDWGLRPVGEIHAERETGGGGTTWSALAGAIWQVREHVALDAAVRYAVEPGNNAVEVRWGLTWGTGL